MRTPKVGDLMTHPVITLKQDDNIHLAMSLLHVRRIRHLPVIDDAGDLIGLVSHRDLLPAQAAVLARPAATAEEFTVPVARIMRTRLWTVRPDTATLEAACIMFDHKVGCLPVLSGQTLVGIVTLADLLGAFITLLERRREREDTDPSIPLEQVRG
jgi:CBS domain-containing membrane protein